MKAVIYMEPVGKARARTVFKHGRVMSFTPTKTAHAETVIRTELMKLRPFYNRSVPLVVMATFFRSRPKSIPKSVTLPTSKPDWDNYAKLLMDAMEKFIYENDSQITTAVIKKRFGSPPRIEIEILTEEP